MTPLSVGQVHRSLAGLVSLSVVVAGLGWKLLSPSVTQADRKAPLFMTPPSVGQVGPGHRSLAGLVSLSVVVAGLGWKLLSSAQDGDTATQANRRAINRHPVYWFNDGSVIVRASGNSSIDSQSDTVMFRIHESLLRRHSQRVLEPQMENGWDVPVLTIPLALGVRAQDFISLLAHLYHDTPLSLDAPFPHIAAVLRVSSPEQLDLPSVHRMAISCFVAMFPSGPTPFVHPEPLDEALCLALQYNITSIQKGIYYSLVTRADSALSPDAAVAQEEEQHAEVSTGATVRSLLTLADVERCSRLLDGMVTHFTPVLFEPPVTTHMACSSLLGERWFPLVVQSAIAENSVYKPLEALEQFKRIDWEAEGLCAACVRERREVWTNAQEEVWERMDVWLSLGGEASESTDN